MSLQFGDLAAAAGMALTVWKFGWSQEYSAPSSYLELGRNVISLGTRLQELRDVFRRAEQSPLQNIPGNDSFRDMRSVFTVLGEPEATIQECWNLLHDVRYFRVDRGHVANIYWNVILESKVADLQQKIESHIIKILALVKPLEMHLTLDVGLLVARYGEAILGELSNRSPVNGQGPSQRAEDANHISIPPYLEYKFEQAAQAAKPDIKLDRYFPMHDGTTALLLLLRDGTRAADLVEEYILVRDLGRQSLIIFNRSYSAGPPKPDAFRHQPNQHQVEALPADAFEIWKREVVPDPIADAVRKLNLVLDVPLKHDLRGYQRKLELFKHNDAFLEMFVRDFSPASPPKIDSSRQKINLRDVGINPIYADPLNKVQNKVVSISTLGANISSSDSLMFLNWGQLYSFQEAMTGYQVLHDFAGVTVLIMENESEPAQYLARVQIWDYQGGTPELESSPEANGRRESSASAATGRRQSEAMSPISPTSSISPDSYNTRRMNPPPQQPPIAIPGGGGQRQLSHGAFSKSPDSFQHSSNKSNESHNSIYSRITDISDVTVLNEKTSIGVKAHTFEKPKEPLVILFLRRNPRRVPAGNARSVRTGIIEDQASSRDDLIMVKIPIGSQFCRLQTTNCDCDGYKQCARHAILIGPEASFFKRNKPLTVQRFRNGNLAELGIWYKPKDDISQNVEKYTAAFIEFTFQINDPQETDKKKFNETVADLMTLHMARNSDYERAKMNVRIKPKQDKDGNGQQRRGSMMGNTGNSPGGSYTGDGYNGSAYSRGGSGRVY